MRLLLHLVSIMLGMQSFPTFAVQPEPIRPKHIIKIIRPREGQPRARDVSAGRAASPRMVDQAKSMGRTRPYQAAKPGEGAPKI